MSAKNRLKLVWTAAVVFSLLIALAMAAVAIDTTFSVSATTEFAKVSTGLLRPPAWRLEGTLFVAGGPMGEQASGRLELNPGVELMFQRIAQGPLRIQCATDADSVGILFPDSGQDGKPLGRRVVLRIDDITALSAKGRHFVAPFRGRLQLGALADSSSETSPMLRSGEVLLIGHTLLGRRRYDGGKALLSQGDTFQVTEDRGSGVGVIVVDERPALGLVYQTVGRVGIVSRYGAQGYSLSASPLSRITNDALIQGTVATFAALFAWVMKVPFWSPSGRSPFHGPQKKTPARG